MSRIVVAGHAVYEAQQARKVAALGVPKSGLYKSGPLCEWQIQESRYGILEAEIVRSNYGYSLRYASGLQNFGLIARAQEILNTTDMKASYEAAVEYAKQWCSRAPNNRFATTSNAPANPET